MDKNAQSLEELLSEFLDYEKKTNGRKFSTYYEAQARIQEALEDTVQALSVVGDSLTRMWEELKTGNIDGNVSGDTAEIKPVGYKSHVGRGKINVFLTVHEALYLAALFEKLEGGVVHEPKD